MTATTTPRRAAHRGPLGEGVETGSDHELADGAARRRAFRPDIHGMRAVAVTLVVLYHCGVPVVRGGYVGVDVFFVISGFLITGHLVAEIDRTGTVSIPGFYARRIRRLLPPALIVIAATVVVARVWGPLLQSTRTAHDGLFAAFYAMNYRLAGQGIDYQQGDAAPSPLQHFWSLAVEEQFYLFWPLLVLGFAMLTRRASPVVRRWLLGLALAGVIAYSLHESVVLTQANGPLAYYGLQTRAWELGVGAMLAVLLPVIARAPRSLDVAATWTGMAMILGAAVIFDDATAFPGSLAAVPVAGAALVVGGGTLGSPRGVVRMLRGRITQFIGHVSYGWYLWHWPVLMLAPGVFGKELTTLENVEVCLLALWFATLSFLLVEQPALRLHLAFRRWLGIGLLMSAIVAATSLGAVALGPSVQGDGARAVSLSVASEAALDAELDTALDVREVPANLTPTVARADADVPPTSKDGCHLSFLEVTQPPCVYGDPAGTTTVLLFGDSHAEQWFGALETIARARHWRLVSWTKAACPLADVTIDNERLGRPFTECDEWRSTTLRAVERLAPDVIVTSQADSLVGHDFSSSRWATATARTLRRLSDATPQLVFLGDTPRAPMDVPGCVADHLDDARQCTVPSDAGLPAPDGSYAYLPPRHAAVRRAVETVELTRVDTQPWFCRGTKCPPVVGDTLVYRDDSHMTQAYGRVLSPVLGEVLRSLHVPS
ncbi:acyltransferase family protein [Aeromicrobium wangtongii]|uniref:acyltransferase family protein n=1 Tax=Aeromicrobium wangtongii TaxID=2969247 RepID=UPI002017D645|nr:acyltransferase family protein [Aeromicrobium wangtongii]MCL3817438.1 acyltransferase [Aeromicrobium wangtongii]